MTYADTPRPPVGIGRERQFEIYVGGASGAFPHVPVFGERLERKARKAMTPEGYAYVAGGAGSEETIRENRAAFERWRIVPRMLRDVSVRDTEVEGWRVRDLDLAYLPFLRGKGIAQYTSDPVSSRQYRRPCRRLLRREAA